MGEAAFERQVRPEEMASMRQLLREAMQAWAFGFSTTASRHHTGYGAQPLACRNAVHRAGLGGVWLDDQHDVWRAAQPRYPPAGNGDRAPGEHALPGLLDQLVLFQVYHNVVLPHASSRQRLLVPETTSSEGAASV